ncbi:hypothetical protein LRS58_12120 [Rhodococcus sp. BH2-1]|nr:hypothetical protein [Rhodococcus sp. BH2-1]
MTATIEQATSRYRAAIQGDDQAEFIAAKSALIELKTGTTLTGDQAAYI